MTLVTIKGQGQRPFEKFVNFFIAPCYKLILLWTQNNIILFSCVTSHDLELVAEGQGLGMGNRHIFLNDLDLEGQGHKSSKKVKK